MPYSNILSGLSGSLIGSTATRSKRCGGKRVVLAGLAACILAGCANQPIIDRKGVDPVAYQRDLNECERYAEQVSVAQKAGAGAVAGAAIGTAIGAILGGVGTGEGAAVGAVQGAATGSGRGVRERRQVIRNCLRNRGYSVLN